MMILAVMISMIVTAILAVTVTTIFTILFKLDDKPTNNTFIENDPYDLTKKK